MGSAGGVASMRSPSNPNAGHGAEAARVERPRSIARPELDSILPRRRTGLGIFGALFYYWQQADAFWEYVWAIFPKAIFWPAYMVYEGFRTLGA